MTQYGRQARCTCFVLSQLLSLCGFMNYIDFYTVAYYFCFYFFFAFLLLSLPACRSFFLCNKNVFLYVALSGRSPCIMLARFCYCLWIFAGPEFDFYVSLGRQKAGWLVGWLTPIFVYRIYMFYSYALRSFLLPFALCFCHFCINFIFCVCCCLFRINNKYFWLLRLHSINIILHTIAHTHIHVNILHHVRQAA